MHPGNRWPQAFDSVVHYVCQHRSTVTPAPASKTASTSARCSTSPLYGGSLLAGTFFCSTATSGGSARPFYKYTRINCKGVYF